GVDGRVAPVRRDQVVQVLLVGAPLPRGDHDVALDTLRPRRLALRQLALGDAVGPVAVILERRAAEIAGELVGHLLARLPGLDAAHPCFFTRLELAERRGDRAGRLLPELMAADAADVLRLLEPVDLRELLRNVALAAELALVGNLEHRIPVDRRVVLRRSRLVRRRHRAQIELLARFAVDLGRIDEAVAAHPNLVFGLGKVGQHVAALIVGHHDLGGAGGKVGGFGDHPDAASGPLAPVTTPPMSSLSMATAVWAHTCAGAAASTEAMPSAATVKYSVALSLMGALLVHVIF